MGTSILIAKLAGPVVLVAAIAMLISAKTLMEIAAEFLKSRPLIFLTGILAMVGGLAIVNSHNIWIAGWPVIITLLGWAMVIGGIVRMVFPALVISIGEAMLGSLAVMRIAGAVWALIGAFVTYEGYFRAP